MPDSDSMPVPDFDTIRAGDNILASPDFASPLTENTPNLSDASPFTSSFSSTHHQTSPPLIDYSDTTLDLVPLFNQSSVVADTHKFNELYFSHSPSMNDGSPPGAGMDIPPLFSSQPSPLFSPEGTFPSWRTTRAGRRSISEPPQSVSSRPDTGGTLGQGNSPTDAPTQRQKHPQRVRKRVVRRLQLSVEGVLKRLKKRGLLMPR
ncbi:hypothetical protein FRC09_005595 [Ceratobasidium sp. 395]|nr:hypothetical protein FRC09_005595 [Ceratobasidium sp. 395]